MRKVPAKYKREASNKNIIHFLESKGFELIEVKYGDEEGKNNMATLSYARFTHPNFKKMKSKDLMPELMFYFHAHNKGSYFFCLGVRPLVGSQDICFPFFGEFHVKCVKKVNNTTLEFVNDALVELFNNFNKFIEFIGYSRAVQLTPKKQKKLFKKLVDVRFFPQFLGSSKTPALTPAQYKQWDISVAGMDRPDSALGIFIRVSLALLDKQLYVDGEYSYVDQKGYTIKTELYKTPISNTHRRFELAKFLYNEFEYTALGEQDEDTGEFVEFNF